MALNRTIDKLEDVAEPLREHYTPDNGKFTLATLGEHPDTVRLAEFRDTNIKLTKALARFDGIDPAAVATDRARLAELEKAKPDARVAELETALVTERAARATLQAAADTSVLRMAVGDTFLKNGGRPNALDYIVGKAREVFDVENGAIVGKVLDPARPGEKLTVDAFIVAQLKDADFAFKPSQGGGAPSRSGGGGGTSGSELRNPTAQELGANADRIRRGELKVVYDN